MQTPSIFTRIINGDISAYKIYEDDKVLAILDTHPVYPGHTLLVPKKQIDHIWDLNDEDYDYLWQVANKIGKHLRLRLKPARVGIIVEGFGVPHAHIHLVPIDHGNDLKNIPHIEIETDDKALAIMAKKLKF